MRESLSPDYGFQSHFLGRWTFGQQRAQKGSPLEGMGIRISQRLPTFGQ
jgi:hypothetical protein